MLDKETVFGLIKDGKAKEVLLWNGPSFWESNDRVLLQGGNLGRSFVSLLADFRYCDAGFELSDIGVRP
jgi:hypothetical protein